MVLMECQKHALVAFSDTLRQEMKKWEVKVSIVEPTGYKTGIVDNYNIFQFTPISEIFDFCRVKSGLSHKAFFVMVVKTLNCVVKG